jgi:HAD superfamily hydrolase (TIGR01549 family)
MLLRGVVFDLDGTLVSQQLDFEAIRREVGLPSGAPLLEALERMTDAERERARATLERHEQTAAATARLHVGVHDFVTWLDGLGLRRAVLSRNSRRSVTSVLQRVNLTFDPVVGREDAPYKPHPAGLWQISKAWQLAPAEILMIGDYLYDLQAGRDAGTRTALITHGKELPFANLADVTFPSFTDLPALLRDWITPPQ